MRSDVQAGQNLVVRALAVALSALCVSACARGEDLDLLAVDAVEPALLERGEPLRIGGSGFVAGRGCRVALSGTLHRAGRPPREVALELEGLARSAEAIEVPLSDADFDALGPQGSFEGRARVAFAAEVGGGRVAGETDVQLDLLDARERHLQAQRRLERSAAELLERIGLELEPESPAFTGLVVGYALEDSAAARAGLRRGDVIVRASSVGVHALSDLVPPPGARSLELALERPPSPRTLSLSVPLAAPTRPALDERQRELAALAAFSLLLVLLLSPWPSLPHWLARCRSRLACAGASPTGLWGAARTPRPAPRGVIDRVQRGLERGAPPLLASLLGVLSVLVTPGQRLHSLSAYLCFAAMALTATLLWGVGSLGTRARTTLALAGRMLVLATVLGCACALHGTRSLEGLVSAQGFAPWHWALAAEPALLLAFPLYVTHAGLALPPIASAQAVAAALSVLGRVLTCALGAVVFLGGWSAPAYVVGELAPPLLVGAVAFVAKVWLLAILVWLARRLELGAARPLRSSALGCGAVVALTLAELCWPGVAALHRVIGPVVVAVAAVALPVSLVWVARSAHPMGRGPVHPAARL